jgi:enterochelin esterase family protein
VSVEILAIDSALLADNPLGDAARREVGVVLPPSYQAQPARRFPVVYLLAGYSGVGLALCNRGGWSEPIDRRLERLVAAGRAREAILVLPDCFTRYGGSQYVDSPAIGRYRSHLTEELIPFIDRHLRTIPTRDGRAVAGRSSGGYGALSLGIDRPDLFVGVAAHAGDSAFELSYQREFGRTCTELERRGGVPGFLRHFDAQPTKSGGDIEVMSNLCCAAAWSPAPRGPYGYGVGLELPFDLATGALVPEVWARWLAADPVRRLDDLEAARRLGGLSALYLDAGRSDEYHLQLGTRQVAERLRRAGVAHVHEEFDGGHMNTAYRYDRSLELLTHALATG